MTGMIAYLLAHGWRVMPTWHWYFADHDRGGWITWTATKNHAVLHCHILRRYIACNP